MAKAKGRNSVRFGVEKFYKQLDALEAAVQKKIVRKALKAGGKIIAKEAKIRAPVDTGELKSKIKVWALKRSRKRIGVLVGTSAKEYTGDQFCGAFVEHGTSKMEPRPWLGPAIEAKRAEATAAVEREMAAGIDREIARLKGK